MTEQQPLAHLRDIHLPAPVSWWPPAPGWCALFFFGIIVLAVGIFIFHKRFMQNRAKRQALKLLAFYQEEYLKTGNSQLTSARISELLKRVALAYFPRARVASLEGDAWIQFLNQSAKEVNFNAVRDHLLELPYQARENSVNLKPLFVRAHQWIKQRGRPCLN